MVWSTSTRSKRLPGDWAQRRQAVRARAHGRCQWVEDGRQCPDQGSECDHIVPGDSHQLTNLQWLCYAHHRTKSIREARAAITARTRTRRRIPRAPGLNERG